MGKVEQLIEQQGFDFTGTCSARELVVREEVRDACAADKCHIYNTNWACPPACGDIYDFERQMHEYDHCTVVQTVGYMEDEFDAETLLEHIGKHRGCLLKGGLLDAEKVQRLLLSDLRGGRLGRVTFDDVPDAAGNEVDGE